MLQPMNGVGTAMEREANASSGSPDTKFSAAAAGIVPSQNARIQVIGVGGGGSNAVAACARVDSSERTKSSWSSDSSSSTMGSE